MKERFVWINRVKLLACVLVVLGHFLTGLIISGIIEDNILLEWFSKTIYYFHVPLFFICSGYLYQNSSKVTNFKEWKNNYKYLTELVMVLNWKIWEHYETNEPLAKLYNDLWEQANNYACNNLKGEELNYFYRTTD